jgi:hypothetical protein
VDQAASQRAHAGTAVAVDVLPDDAKFSQTRDEGPRKLGPLPVPVDHRQHLVVDEPPGRDEPLPFRLAELVADEEVVSRQRLAEMGVRHHRYSHVHRSLTL